MNRPTWLFGPRTDAELLTKWSVELAIVGSSARMDRESLAELKFEQCSETFAEREAKFCELH